MSRPWPIESTTLGPRMSGAHVGSRKSRNLHFLWIFTGPRNPFACYHLFVGRSTKGLLFVGRKWSIWALLSFSLIECQKPSPMQFLAQTDSNLDPEARSTLHLGEHILNPLQVLWMWHTCIPLIDWALYKNLIQMIMIYSRITPGVHQNAQGIPAYGVMHKVYQLVYNSFTTYLSNVPLRIPFHPGITI